MRQAIDCGCRPVFVGDAPRVRCLRRVRVRTAEPVMPESLHSVHGIRPVVCEEGSFVLSFGG